MQLACAYGDERKFYEGKKILCWSFDDLFDCDSVIEFEESGVFLEELSEGIFEITKLPNEYSNFLTCSQGVAIGKLISKGFEEGLMK